MLLVSWGDARSLPFTRAEIEGYLDKLDSYSRDGQLPPVEKTPILFLGVEPGRQPA